jgi:hypothetical protein
VPEVRAADRRRAGAVTSISCYVATNGTGYRRSHRTLGKALAELRWLLARGYGQSHVYAFFVEGGR